VFGSEVCVVRQDASHGWHQHLTLYCEAHGGPSPAPTPAPGAAPAPSSANFCPELVGPGPAPAPAPGGAGELGVGFFSMQTRDWSLIGLFRQDASEFSLAVAARLSVVIGMPVARFTMLLPNPQMSTGFPTLACVSDHAARLTSNEEARWANEDNTTFSCFESAVTASEAMGGALLQLDGQNKSQEALLQKPAFSFPSWSVGVYPPTGIAGDTEPGDRVAASLARAQYGSTMPERHLEKNGRWRQRPGLGFRFNAIFPGTNDRETSIILGPNPGGHGAIALPPTVPPPPGATTPPPPPMSEAQFLGNSHEINTIAGTKFWRLVGAIKQASRQRWEAYNGQPYTPFDTIPPSGALFPAWSGAGQR